MTVFRLRIMVSQIRSGLVSEHKEIIESTHAMVQQPNYLLGTSVWLNSKEVKSRD